MKCRKSVKNNNGQYNIVWFGSIGKDQAGNKIPYENYSEKQEGVRDSLVQRLSVLKGELWYKMSYGLPLVEKIRDKGIYDSIVLNIIRSHPAVTSIVNFKSQIIDNHTYSVQFSLITTYTSDETILEFNFSRQ